MPSIADLTDWLDANTSLNIVWFVKRLAANDTLASGGHQAGPYIPKEFVFDVFPSLHRPQDENPDKRFELRIDSHPDVRQARAIWYNNRMRGGTRNEARITNLGGAASALLDPDSTGALTVFAFHRGPLGEADTCHVWVCEHEIEEDLIEDRTGPVDPGNVVIWSINEEELIDVLPNRQGCWLQLQEIPRDWLLRFPPGVEIVRKSVELRPGCGLPVDTRLLTRRDCEFEIFRSLEEVVELPTITRGFATLDEFVSRAQIILQRRKARSGRSLELQAREIFVEENLVEGTHFQYQPESEPGKCPDFLFPSERHYKDLDFPTAQLRMLAVKTTCKDRWRQILNEAQRVSTKHLLTLQQGVSERQFGEMTQAHVQLVVPAPLIATYPQNIRPHLQTLESFIADVRLLNLR